MLTDFQNFFIVGFSNKFAASFCYIAYHTLSVSLHYLVKLKYWKCFRAQELSSANRSARLVHLKMLKNARKVTWILLGLLTRIRSSYASQKNPQDNRIYAPAASRKKQVAPERLLPTCLTFSKSLMVTVGVFKFGENGSDIGRSWSEDQWRILPDESSLRWWTEAAYAQSLALLGAMRDQRRNKWVSQTSPCVYSYQRWTWAFTFIQEHMLLS